VTNKIIAVHAESVGRLVMAAPRRSNSGWARATLNCAPNLGRRWGSHAGVNCAKGIKPSTEP